jgi:glycosyltransferase involved in cell wall biosynthesis
MISRLAGYAGKASHWLNLLRTARGGSAGVKLLAYPSYRGGPSTKVDQLKSLLAAKGEAFGTVLALSAVAAPIALVKRLKSRGARILVNQNGVYYPSWAGASYLAQNLYLRRLNELADHTFFQSEFAKESYVKWVGPVPRSHSILFNGVDTNAFRPGPRRAESPVVVLFFCDFKESYRPYWEALGAWLSHVSFPLRPENYRVLAVGNCAGEERPFLCELERRWEGLPVQFHANVPRADIPGLVQRANVLVHVIYNDVCPNKVLEAMACGVWPICVSAGGTRELVGDAGTVLEVPAGYEEPRLPSSQELSRAFAVFLGADRAALSARARARAECFTIEAWRNETQKKAKAP